MSHPLTWFMGKRIGKFEIRGEQFHARCDMANILPIFNNVLVIRANDCPGWDGIRYTAVSRLFQPLEECETIPYYRPVVGMFDGKFVFLRFARMKKQWWFDESM